MIITWNATIIVAKEVLFSVAFLGVVAVILIACILAVWQTVTNVFRSDALSI